MQSYYTEPSNRYGELYASYAHSFRDIAFEIDANPQNILNYTHLPAIQFIVSDCNSSTLQRTQYLEALGYGDAGVLLASPGPSLSGLMLRELGLPEQIDYFYKIIKEKNMRTFFALTEPEKGSDANHIQTRLIIDNNKNNFFSLTGTKSFFGNGAVADTGIVLARLSDGPAGIRAIWLTPDLMQQHSIEKNTLPMFALRGAQIALIKFNQTSIPREFILGNHLSTCENGLLGIAKVFNRLRTGVGALAIGQAQAVFDLIFLLKQKNLGSLKSLFSYMSLQLLSARKMLHDAAMTIDSNACASYSPSLAKSNATYIAEKIITTCIDLCTMDELLSSPWLIKSYRDVFCWEFMEGSTPIQKRIISGNLNQIVKKIKQNECIL